MAKNKIQHAHKVSAERCEHSARYIWLTAVILIAGLLLFWRLSPEWFWKLAPQILGFLFLFTVSILDYEWHGEGTTRHKLLRQFLFLLILASLIGTVVQTVKAD